MNWLNQIEIERRKARKRYTRKSVSPLTASRKSWRDLRKSAEMHGKQDIYRSNAFFMKTQALSQAHTRLFVTDLILVVLWSIFLPGSPYVAMSLHPKKGGEMFYLETQVCTEKNLAKCSGYYFPPSSTQ